MNNINVSIHYSEGFSYVEYNGEFFKGCRRCGGTGHYSFNGMDSICYLCGNSSDKLGEHLGTQEDAIKWCHGKAVRRAQADRKREQVRLAKLAKRDAAWQALKDAHPAVWEMLSGVVGVAIPFEDGMGSEYTNERDAFVCQLADKLWRLDEIGFSPRQLEVLEQIATKRAERKETAAATPAPTGREVVTGEILATKTVEGDYGTAYKITVKDDRGFRVYVSLPKAQSDEVYHAWQATLPEGVNEWALGADWFHAIKGRRITFTATLEQSRDDVSFAFGSRPAKGAWL